ncbi:MAG: glycosyltransferase [Treponema sp.]|nr:glycosyltransferase [Treponema sp.]
MAVNNDELIFSVVVIAYNQEKYIEKTLDSILSQEHSYSYEIIIGDDCSSDKTPQIIEEYRKSYPSIVKPIYNSKNLGAMNNYYNTISKVKGKYIMICGGDDYWLPLKVET